jgi:hypothetical protein
MLHSKDSKIFFAIVTMSLCSYFIDDKTVHSIWISKGGTNIQIQAIWLPCFAANVTKQRSFSPTLGSQERDIS